MPGQIKNLKMLRNKVADLTELLEMEHPCDIKALKSEIEDMCKLAQRKMKECEDEE